MSQFRSRFNVCAFAADQRANVAMIFAVSALVLIGLTGMGVDYYTALSSKAQLDLAADAASIEAITTVNNYIKANASTNVTTAFNKIQATAVTQGQNAFVVNAGKTYARTMTAPPTPVVTLGSDQQTVTATVNYTAASPNAFGPLFSIKQIKMSGTSSASLTLPKYIDFYMALDMSGSMGFPSQSGDQTTLAGKNPDMLNQYPSGCSFACHFSDPVNLACSDAQNQKVTCKGYQVAGANNIPLRAQAVGEAIGLLISNAKLTMQNTGLTNQFRLGIYPFITSMDVFYPPSSDSNYPHPSNNLDAANTQINNLGCFNDQGTIVPNGQGLSNLLDEGSSPLYPQPCSTNVKYTTLTTYYSQKKIPIVSYGSYGSGGTNVQSALSSIVNYINSQGNGSSSSASMPFVVLVTDGVQNGQTYLPQKVVASSNFNGSTPAKVDSSWCTTVKSKATLAVLYIDYETIQKPNSSFANNEDGKVNALIPNIPSNLQQCASPNFYFYAQSGDDINNAMVQIFYQAVDQVAHLTH